MDVLKSNLAVHDLAARWALPERASSGSAFGIGPDVVLVCSASLLLGTSWRSAVVDILCGRLTWEGSSTEGPPAILTSVSLTPKGLMGSLHPCSRSRPWTLCTWQISDCFSEQQVSHSSRSEWPAVLRHAQFTWPRTCDFQTDQMKIIATAYQQNFISLV